MCNAHIQEYQKQNTTMFAVLPPRLSHELPVTEIHTFMNETRNFMNETRSFMKEMRAWMRTIDSRVKSLEQGHTPLSHKMALTA